MTDEAFAATIASSKNHPRSGSFFKGPACGTACECEVGPRTLFHEAPWRRGRPSRPPKGQRFSLGRRCIFRNIPKYRSLCPYAQLSVTAHAL